MRKIKADMIAPPERKFSVAPMMDWTDRHCRFFMRTLTKKATLFTEMVTAPAIIHGDKGALLGFHEVEHPLVLQLGGSDPQQLAQCAKIAENWGYDEVNLNVGCPSDRVKSGSFGACLMQKPQLVADCVRAMKSATTLPISVKCRLGVDDQDTERDLDVFIDAVVEAGVDLLYVHARKAWLQGLSPKENREVPPLDYDRVFRLAARVDCPVIINGGIADPQTFPSLLECTSGIMLGREAYHNPRILRDVDAEIFDENAANKPDFETICATMCDYAENHLANGGRLNHITRHMLGLAAGMPGARKFRQMLSVQSVKPETGPELIERAFAQVDFSPAAATTDNDPSSAAI